MQLQHLAISSKTCHTLHFNRRTEKSYGGFYFFSEPISYSQHQCCRFATVPNQTLNVLNNQFTYRLDIYWKAISMYAVALILYGLVRGVMGGLPDGTIKLVLLDPVLILLFAFVIGSSLSLLVNWYMRREIIITNNALIFKNRFREREIPLSQIERINIGREKIIKVRGAYKLVKIRLNTRRRLLRIRTSSFNNEQQLVESLIALKKSHGSFSAIA